jgi:hypothetical protein
MSGSLPSPRIERKQKPPRYYFAHRNYLKYLLLDFEKRCAYSQQHLQRVGGVGGMDIDHHNPGLTHPKKNDYANLYLATRHCNGKKGDEWPSRKQVDSGIRFLDPCAETDYGVHLFEDPDTFEIWGATPAGRYHIRMLDLNADHLIRERRRRHELLALIKQPQIATAIRDDALKGVQAFREEVRDMIPALPQKRKPPRNLTN